VQTAFTRLSDRCEKILNHGWIRSVFYTGVMAASQTTNGKKYLETVLN
jgi:hypothetical protein